METKRHKIRIGLVLGGGGAKGAYQVGVFKALRELGVDHFECIAGTSVGALNSILFATTEPDEALQTWKQMAGFLTWSKTFRITIQTYLKAYVLLFMAPAAMVLSLLVWIAGFLHSHSTSVLLVSSISSWVFTMILWADLSEAHTQQRTTTFIMPWSSLGYPFTYVAIAVSMFLIVTLAHCFPSFLNSDQLSRSEQAIILIGFLGFAALFWIINTLWKSVIALRLCLIGKARRHGLFDTAALTHILQRYLSVPPGRWRTDKVFAAVARDAKYLEPFSVDSSELIMKFLQTGSSRSGLALPQRKWVPKYLELKSRPVEERLKALLCTSAIPWAFPGMSDGSGDYCDGGLVDNVPLAVAVNCSECDLIVVVPLNRGEMPKPRHLQAKLDQHWRDAVLPDLTRNQLRELLDGKLMLYQREFNECVPGRRRIAAGQVVVIAPCRPLASANLPIVRFFTGTLNFSERAIDEWFRLGYQDGLRQLRSEIAGRLEKVETSAEMN